MRWQASSDVHVLPDTFDTGSLVEISSSDCFPEELFGHVSSPSKTTGIPQNIKVRSTGYNFHFLELHDIFELRANLPSLPEKLRMQEMTGSPVVPEAVRFLVNEHDDV